MKVLQSSFFRAVIAIVVGLLLIKYREATAHWLTIAIGALFFISGLISCVVYYSMRKHADEPQVVDAQGMPQNTDKPSFPIVGLGSLILGIILALMPSTFLAGLTYIMAAILILTIWKDFGYAVIILLGGMYALPTECYEAAEIDGATAWNRFCCLTLPLLKPTILFIVITSLISYFQTYIPVMVLTEGGPGTQTYLASYLIYDQAFSKYNFGYASALSFVLFVFIAALTGISFKVSGKSNIS